MADANLSMPAEDPQPLDTTAPVEPHQELETVSYLAATSAPASPLLGSTETKFVAVAPGQTIDEVLLQPRLATPMAADSRPFPGDLRHDLLRGRVSMAA